MYNFQVILVHLMCKLRLAIRNNILKYMYAINCFVRVISVVIQSNETVQPLNEDTILFLDGHTVLGQVRCLVSTNIQPVCFALTMPYMHMLCSLVGLSLILTEVMTKTLNLFNSLSSLLLEPTSTEQCG